MCEKGMRIDDTLFRKGHRSVKLLANEMQYRTYTLSIQFVSLQLSLRQCLAVHLPVSTYDMALVKQNLVRVNEKAVRRICGRLVSLP